MVLSHQSLKKITTGVKPMIVSQKSLEGRFQPAGLDICSGNRCFRVSVSAMPDKQNPMSSLLKRFALYDFEIKKEGSLLENRMTYIIPLSVNLSLSDRFYSVFSPKSTTGRNDVFGRVLTEWGGGFDSTSGGYEGQLYLEVTPLSFHSMIFPDDPLTQMRVASVNSIPLTNEELAVLHSEYGLVRDQDGNPTEAVIHDGALYLHLNLGNNGMNAGYESLKNPEGCVHVGKKQIDVKEEFFRQIKPTPYGDLILHPDHFYLLHTFERVVIPPCVCATMQEYSVTMGEFRSHYAGFFDNGFGGKLGTYGVLEFRPRDIAIRVCHGQPICRMVFYKTDEVPEQIYGSGINNYTSIGPCLAKNIIDYQSW